MAGLTLAEEIILLSLDDETGRPLGRAGMAPDLALAGALLMDLALARRIDTDRDRIWVADDAPTWDPVLDVALGALAVPGTPDDARGVIILLARQAGEIRAALMDRMLEAGLLQRVEDKVLWVFRDRRHPKAPGRDEAATARTRLRTLLLEEEREIPEPRDALLLGLARAAGLLPALFSAEELRRIQDWLDLVTRIESLNRSLSTAVAEVRGARNTG
jgi:Golgi phosphoprotein 3